MEKFANLAENPVFQGSGGAVQDQKAEESRGSAGVWAMNSGGRS